MRFSGLAELSDGARHDVEVGFGPPGVSLHVGGVEIGAWQAGDCRMVETGPSEYRIEVEDDYFVFIPADPVAFRQETEVPHDSLAQRMEAVAIDHGPGATPAAAPAPVEEVDQPAWQPSAESLESSQVPVTSEPDDLALPPPVPQGSESPGPGGLPWWAALAGGAAILVIVVLAASSLFGGRNGEPVILTTTTTELVDVRSTVFDRSPAEFVATWNATSQSFRADLPVTVGVAAFEQEYSPFLRLEWQVGGAGSLAGYQVVVDTSGPADSGRTGLAALGVAIGVADPTLDAAGRRAVLAKLGYDVGAPSLAGLDGRTEQGGIRFSLRYVPEFSTLLFSVAPAGG